MSTLWRIGCVPYLNARPFLLALDAEPLLLPPWDLAQALGKGEVDVALVPVAYLLDHPQARLLGPWGIACDGVVHSVILAHEVPWDEVRTVAPDEESRTSNLLAKVLLKDLWQRQVQWLSHGSKENADARVIIGDRAMVERARENGHLGVKDLGLAWKELTGLPFVFARWILRDGVAWDGDQAAELEEAFASGVKERTRLAASALEQRYLTEWIRHKIGPAEEQGQREFLSRATGLASERR